MNDLALKIKAKLEQSGLNFEFIQLPEDLPMDVASHMEFHGKEMKYAMPNMIFKTDKGLIVAQRRADTQIDNKKLRQLLGTQSLSLAGEEDLASLGLKPGIVPPMGYSTPIYLDKKVLENEEIYTGTGDKTFSLKINPQDLVKISGAIVADFTRVDETYGKKRILTGDTPTGKAHLGHYVGTFENRVMLQDNYETFIIEADTHALSTLSATPERIAESVRQMTIDNLSCGLDPAKVTIFIESEVPEIYELAAFFSMYVSHNRALRNPTVKDEIKMKGLGDQFSLGFVNYPIYQAADILCLKGELVPVGVDQEAHLEQSRELARDFNKLAGYQIFPEPQALVGRVGKLVGTDGNPKMSKSLGNTIYLSDTIEEVEKKVMNMYTDPKRIHSTDPGKVSGNPVFIYLNSFAPDSEKPRIKDYEQRYTTGQVGDIEVKKYLVEILNNFLDPIRKKRAEYESQPELIDKILKQGTENARGEAQKTLMEVKKAMKLDYFTNS